MDITEIAYEVRGAELRFTDFQVWTRWMTACLLQPHMDSKKPPIKPTDLISLGKEIKEAGENKKSKLAALRQLKEIDNIQN